jgi:hypothetical protein
MKSPVPKRWKRGFFRYCNSKFVDSSKRKRAWSNKFIWLPNIVMLKSVENVSINKFGNFRSPDLLLRNQLITPFMSQTENVVN